MRSTSTVSPEDARTSASSVGATNPEAAAVEPDSSLEATGSPARVSNTSSLPLFSAVHCSRGDGCHTFERVVLKDSDV